LLVVLNAEDGAVPRGVVRWVLVDVVKLDLEAASLADAARPFMGIHHARRDLGRNGRSDLGHQALSRKDEAAACRHSRRGRLT
uniref:hypothetical protein n=1 Tax=Providencia stuartii TaxID=588 RepID=UPI001953F162